MARRLSQYLGGQPFAVLVAYGIGGGVFLGGSLIMLLLVLGIVEIRLGP